jgi:pimeloyl-ACP methyl ester carboxylesterase
MLAVAVVAVAVVAACLGVVPTVGAHVATADPLSSSALTWHRCGGGFHCGTLTVPLADDAPDTSVGLAVVRMRARRPSARIGSLVVNPGGPGVPAVEFLRGAAASLPTRIRDRFDLVAFDPRGIGDSRPVQCVTTLDPLFDQSFEPVGEQERASLVDAATAVARGCAGASGTFLAHLSTADAVRDLERLRVALGDDRLSFLGYSYGTFLGASYANAHPDRVRAFVLDGPVDASMSARSVTLGQARGFEHALDDFLADCSAHPGCSFHHDGDAEGAYDALRARAARTPLAANDANGRTLNQTRFDAAVLQQLYLGRRGWPGLADALAAADDGDASTLLAGADAFAGRDSTGRDDGALEAFWAVSCLDGPVIGGPDAAAALERDAVAVAPRMGAFIVNNSLPCSVWPVAPLGPPATLVALGAPPILVIGTTDDPATPLSQARSVARTFARARLLVAQGEQHTSFDNGNRCVDAVVTRYLVDDVLPRAGKRC